MQIRFRAVFAIELVLFTVGVGGAQSAQLVEAPLQGNWKLVALAFGEDDFAIVKLAEHDGKTTATKVDAQSAVGLSDVKSAELKGDTLTLTLTGPVGDTPFKGNRVKEGPDAGQFLGTINYRGNFFPARLEPTKDVKTAPIKQSAIRSKYQEIIKNKDLKSKIKALEEAIEANRGKPAISVYYAELLSSAEAAGLEPSRVADLAKKWMNEARPYGDEWTTEVRLKTLKAVGASKTFAKMTVELAKEAEKLVAEEAIEAKVTVLESLLTAARAAGMDELAKDTEARYNKLSERLDEEYHHKVPPFKPAAYAGRQSKTADQVVLMELFTGAQCPPCVAADVAFDALLTTFKPTDFIGLQYHLHIPGPDPLTNRDSQARQQYYGPEVQGTPSTFFNGQSKAGGGGLMGNSQEKYTEYRDVIDKTLEGARKATIDLKATGHGDKIEIVASAKVTATPSGEKGKDEGDKPKPVLRLALTEESVRYVGSNKLRFHHHVVRAFPGGTDGKELINGAGTVTVTLDLAKVKKDLETYLSDYAESRKFPGALPAIKLDHLAVVAFVQDDRDKTILHAVSVPVELARP
jgi:hypothetical protein